VSAWRKSASYFLFAGVWLLRRRDAEFGIGGANRGWAALAVAGLPLIIATHSERFG